MKPAIFPEAAGVAVSLSFDDARPSQLEAVRILDEHGVRATFYVLPRAVASARERWAAVASSGHEIGNHSYTHPCSVNFDFARRNALENQTMDEVAADIDEASRRIEELLAVRPRTFAYPCGQSFVGRGRGRQSYVRLIAERFVAGRGYGSETSNRPDLCDLAHLEAYAIDGMHARALQSLVQAGMTHGAWVIMVGHDVGRGGRQTVSPYELDRFCRQLARDERVWVAPVVVVAQRLLATRSGRPGAPTPGAQISNPSK